MSRSGLDQLKMYLHMLVDLYNPYKGEPISKRSYGALFESSKSIYRDIHKEKLESLLHKLTQGNSKYTRMVQMFYVLKSLLEQRKDATGPDTFAVKMKDDYWDSAHRAHWLGSDLILYTNYLTEAHEKNRKTQDEQQAKIELLIERTARLEANYGAVTGDVLVEETEMQERDRQDRLRLLERENEDLKQKLIQMHAEKHSEGLIKTQFMRRNAMLEDQIKDIGRKVAALSICTKRTEMLDRKVKQLYDSHQILVNHNNILIDMAISTHYELDVVNAKYTDAQEKLAQCRNPEKMRDLLDETLNSNKALLMLWQQMQMLKSANFINGFFEQIIRLLIMSTGTMKEKPEMLQVLNEQALSQITRPPECSKCTVLKDLLLRVLELMFSCGMNPGPSIMQQVSNAGVIGGAAAAGGEAMPLLAAGDARGGFMDDEAGLDDFSGLHLGGNALNYANLKPAAAAAAPAQPKKKTQFKPPDISIQKVPKATVVEKITGGDVLRFVDDRQKKP